MPPVGVPVSPTKTHACGIAKIFHTEPGLNDVSLSLVPDCHCGRLGTVENFYFGPELKDCISPAGQLLADSGAKKTLFKVSSGVSVNCC